MSFFEKTRAFLGFDEDILEEISTRPERKVAAPPQRAQPRTSGKLLPFSNQQKRPGTQPAANQDVVILMPRCYEDSLTVSGYLKRGNPVVVNIKNLDNATGKRFIDFVCGSAYAFDGNMHRLGGTIFLFTPAYMGIVPIDEETTINVKVPQIQQQLIEEEPAMQPSLLQQQYQQPVDEEGFEFFDPIPDEETADAFYANAR